MMTVFYQLLASCTTTFIVCLLIVTFRHRHIHISSNTVTGIQDVHQGEVPRIGGVAIFFGLLVSWILSTKGFGEFTAPLLLSAFPIFLIGFLEDITGKVSVGLRFVFSFLGALLAMYLTGIGITQVGIGFVDAIISTPIGSYLFTAFAVAGIVNAINIVDGFNGLSSAVVISASLVFAYLSFMGSDELMVQYCLSIVAVTIGFALVNYPKGLLFLGDGGAYVLGFLVAWMAILVPHRTEHVSSWASLLVLSYPVIEVLFTIYRRVKRRQHPGHPDRLHLHSLIYSRLIRKWFPGRQKYIQNALVVPLVLIYMMLSEILVISFYTQKDALMVCFVVCFVAYMLVYRRLIYFRWR